MNEKRLRFSRFMCAQSVGMYEVLQHFCFARYSFGINDERVQLAKIVLCDCIGLRIEQGLQAVNNKRNALTKERR